MWLPRTGWDSPDVMAQRSHLLLGDIRAVPGLATETLEATGEPRMVMRASVSGPAHVFTYADAELEEAAGGPLVGVPLREAFADPAYHVIFDMYDFARAWGLPVSIDTVNRAGVLGTLTLSPLPKLDAIDVSWLPRSHVGAAPGRPRVPRRRRRPRLAVPLEPLGAVLVSLSAPLSMLA